MTGAMSETLDETPPQFVTVPALTEAKPALDSALRAQKVSRQSLPSD